MTQQDTVIYQKGILPFYAGDLGKLTGIQCQLHLVEPDAEITSIAAQATAPVQKGSIYITYDETDDVIRDKILAGDGTAVLTDHIIEGAPCILTSNRDEALYHLARYLYRAVPLPVVAVAGSVGKTTTKRMTAEVLNRGYRVFYKAGNWNSLHAVACCLQEIPAETECIVQEIDESRLGNLALCSGVLCPEIAMITNVGESHIGFLGGRAALEETFRGISNGLTSDNSVLILNSDDEGSMKTGFHAKNIILVAIHDKEADCRAQNICNGAEGTEFDVCFRERQEHISLSVFGEHNVYDAMMAYVAGKLKGIPSEEILKGLKNYRNSGIRQNICCIGGETVYADCYNASPTSIAFAVKTFCELPGVTGRKVAVIGDIAQIEGYEEECYRRIAETVDASTLDDLVTYGKDSETIWNYLTRPMRKRHVKTPEELHGLLRALRAGGGTATCSRPAG